MSGATTTIGGSITYASGNGPDQVQLDNTTVGKNATFNLGSGGDIATPQFVNLGTTSTTPVEIAGALTIKGGADTDSIDIMRTRVGGAFSVKTLAGDDTVKIDDTDVIEAASIDLGTGGGFSLNRDASHGRHLSYRFAIEHPIRIGLHGQWWKRRRYSHPGCSRDQPCRFRRAG